MAEDQKTFEIYKLAVEMADRVSSRRMAANGFFLSVHTALVAILGFSYETFAADNKFALVIIGMMGLLAAIIWFFALRSYRRLNRSKFNIINEMEKDLPFDYFTREWDDLQKTTKSDLDVRGLRQRWLNFKDRYTTLTNVESIVPVVFAIIYVVIAVDAIFGVIA